MKALFIGLGSIGQRHLRNLIEINPKIKLSALRHSRSSPVLSINNEILSKEDVSQYYGINDFTSLEEALASEPDLIFITNPSHLHAKLAFTCLENSQAYIFIEKPLSSDIESAQRLLQHEISSQKKRICIGYQFRFHPVIKLAKSILSKGKLGNIVSANLENGEYMPGWHPYEDYRKSYAAKKELGGGALLTQIHDFDYAIWLFGIPHSIYAVGGKLSDLEIDVEDSVKVLMTFHKNNQPIPVNISLDYLQWPAKKQFSIIGDKGKIECDLIDMKLSLHTLNNHETEIFGFPEFDRNDMFKKELEHFLDFTQGKSEPFVDIETAMLSLEVALNAHLSIKEGKSIDFKNNILRN
jgi:predicted dehydrogenase